MNPARRMVHEPATFSRHPAYRCDPHKLKCTDVEVATSDGVSLAVRDYRTPSVRHTVVLLHGLCESDAVWARQTGSLLRRRDGIRVITYDHRGHGRSSSAPSDTYRIEQLAGDLAEVLTALNVGGPMTLVGHSMGGMAALAYLGRPDADRPVDPHGLVLSATAAGKLTERGLGRLLATPGAGSLLRLVDRIPTQARTAVARPLCSALGKFWPAQRDMLDALAGAAATTAAPTAAGFLPALRGYDQYRSLADIRARTVVVSGGVDPLTPARHSEEIADAIPGATHVHVPQVGHMLHSEAPHVIDAAIRRAMLPVHPWRLPAFGADVSARTAVSGQVA